MNKRKTLKIVRPNDTVVYKDVEEFVFGYRYMYISYILDDVVACLVVDLEDIISVHLKKSEGNYRQVKLPKRVTHDLH